MRTEGICKLDFDPVFASQDPSVLDLDIGSAKAGFIPVEFKNPANNQKTKLEFRVVMISGQWKIADIVYKSMDGVSLKKILARSIPWVSPELVSMSNVKSTNVFRPRSASLPGLLAASALIVHSRLA